MSSQPLIIGHRGSSSVAPENTIAAFKRSILDGADGIEFDVRLAGDGVLVVIHDATPERTARPLPRSGIDVRRRVSELTSTELFELDAGAWFSADRGTEPGVVERIPTLTQVFELFSGATGSLYLEMKGEPVGEPLVAAVARLIRDHSFTRRVIVESFDLAAIAQLKRLAPEIRTAALFEIGIPRSLPLISQQSILSNATAVAADEIALHHRLASNRLIAAGRKAGFEVVVWTVDDPQWITRALASGIKALITNDPARLLQHRQRLAAN